MPDTEHLTPKQIVTELDKFIIGQDDAKRAVAVAIRNRWRRQQLKGEIREEVAPKNIIMAGPTGVGKTEIARRLATLVQAPFVKIEATKFTEVGYVGRDVESMVRDLVERSIKMVREEQDTVWAEKAEQGLEESLLDLLLPRSLSSSVDASADQTDQVQQRHERTRNKLREQLRAGALEDRRIEISMEEKSASVNILSNVSMDQMDPGMQDMFDKLMPSRTVQRTMTVAEARDIVYHQELDNLIDHDKVVETALARAEQSGLIFLDEVDKLCGSDGHGPDVSREGVQRDLLPLVEGCSVNTKHGIVKTDHILFIAAGAFSRNKPSDMMPELQGRFPIRVKLQDLGEEEFRRILTEPKCALTIQQVALMKTEGITIKFTDDGITRMAEKAFQINKDQQNIGARRLYAIMEKVLEDVSFEAPDCKKKKFTIDASFVDEHLSKVSGDEDLNIFGFAAAAEVRESDH
jgi:ATP-dependent HslUV protease ATP-binding subunit HslU